MKFTSLALLSVVATTSGFSPLSTATIRLSKTSLNYSVGIVGATGAVGKEIRQVLETRNKLPVDELRIFGSERSAGSTVTTKYGDVKVELFSEKAARECDVVFLAVDGDFALAHAMNIAEGDDGAVVIDNSVGNGQYEAWRLVTNQPSFFSFIASVIVGLSIPERHPIGRSRNQWQGNQKIQVDCQSQLHDCDWPHGAVAVDPKIWCEAGDHEYVPSLIGSWSTGYG
jgi:hypothetical protein